MKPLLEAARKDPKRGDLRRRRGRARAVRRADDPRGGAIADCIVIGRPDVIKTRLERYGLTIRPGDDFTIVDPEDDPRYRDYVQTYVDAGRFAWVSRPPPPGRSCEPTIRLSRPSR